MHKKKSIIGYVDKTDFDEHLGPNKDPMGARVYSTLEALCKDRKCVEKECGAVIVRVEFVRTVIERKPSKKGFTPEQVREIMRLNRRQALRAKSAEEHSPEPPPTPQ